ncbi:ClpXP protease specificity-enhancing factor SspB [Hyphococcus flavus]|uniref:ClpXP protease specificity-enhancing factor SspB n=1 Tax=Hyphococcus flavus TaxID=1866326 RepID=A0AAE9ZG11_9PROT|nr:ClpXP protease specificity-enhancing factor SspB [Hyphococcus flavus]WDI32072.1 ClpXP protease specificity-enhancing factor SspB [Hyphococcus flavus]
MSEDIELDYSELIQEAQKKAYRFLMRDVLNIVAEIGDAPGEHHFFIEFGTEAPGVVIPDHLKEQYPELMTIVLQHQFEDLTVSDDGFGVTLWFKGKESRLEIPYDAVTQFADPSAQFGIRFDAQAAPENEEAEQDEKPADEKGDQDNSAESASEASDEESAEKENDGADVVSLDAFRKK